MGISSKKPDHVKKIKSNKKQKDKNFRKFTDHYGNQWRLIKQEHFT